MISPNYHNYGTWDRETWVYGSETFEVTGLALMYADHHNQLFQYNVSILHKEMLKIRFNFYNIYHNRFLMLLVLCKEKSYITFLMNARL